MSKDSKKQPAHQPDPKHVEPPAADPSTQQKQIPEQQGPVKGKGRFEFPDGSLYVGDWELLDGKKVKHGKGKFLISSQTEEYGQKKEFYEGDWDKDQMHGFGFYQYKVGATYEGHWQHNKQNGHGKYTFPDGTIYEGEWQNHQINGDGFYIDKSGKKWVGEFVNGQFLSKAQEQLKIERLIKKREEDIKISSNSTFSKFIDVYGKSDKKTFKDNLLPFFANEDTKTLVKEPYTKYEEKPPEKIFESIKFIKENHSINILRKPTQAQIIDPANIIAQQFYGIGQIVEFQRTEGARICKIVLCNTSEGNWQIVQLNDTGEPEAPKKK